MDTDLNRNNDPAKPAAAPEWMMELLRSEWPESPGFDERCNQAVDQAWQLARLRRQVEMAGEWVPRPVSDYLRSLAVAARVPLDGVVEWAGLPADLRPGDCARVWLGPDRKCPRLGMSRGALVLSPYARPGRRSRAAHAAGQRLRRCTRPAGVARRLGSSAGQILIHLRASRCSVHSVPPRT